MSYLLCQSRIKYLFIKTIKHFIFLLIYNKSSNLKSGLRSLYCVWWTVPVSVSLTSKMQSHDAWHLTKTIPMIPCNTHAMLCYASISVAGCLWLEPLGFQAYLYFGIRPNETTPSQSDWCCLPAGVNLVHVGCIIEQDSAACALHAEPWKELKSPTWRHQTLHIPLYCSHMAADLIFFLPQQGIKLATNLDCERRH